MRSGWWRSGARYPMAASASSFPKWMRRRRAMAAPSSTGRATGACSTTRAARRICISRSPCCMRTQAARAVPVDKALWSRSFPQLAPLIARIGDIARYDRFEYIRLKRWSAGRVAVIGDAAHAIPPNIGQGAGCAMMNALALGVYLDRSADIPAALAAWEAAERPLTDHTQRISLLFGMPAFWPPKLRELFYFLAARSRWLTAQRTRTARHVPTGT